MVSGLDPVLALGVPNIPTDDRRLDLVSLFSGYGLETTKIIPPKNIKMKDVFNQRFEDYTHHSIMNFLSDDDDIPISTPTPPKKEKEPFKAMNHVSSIDLNKLCELDPHNRLCRKKRLSVKYL